MEQKSLTKIRCVVKIIVRYIIISEYKNVNDQGCIEKDGYQMIWIR